MFYNYENILWYFLKSFPCYVLELKIFLEVLARRPVTLWFWLSNKLKDHWYFHLKRCLDISMPFYCVYVFLVGNCVYFTCVLHFVT